jgi:hypothetical protein
LTDWHSIAAAMVPADADAQMGVFHDLLMQLQLSNAWGYQWLGVSCLMRPMYQHSTIGGIEPLNWMRNQGFS